MSMRYLVPFDDPRVGAFSQVRPMWGARRLARWLLALFLLFALALGLVPWQQTAYGEGRVVAASPLERQQQIHAPQEGWLEVWYVQEGARVEAGDPIARIVDNDPQLLERLRTEVDAVRARVAAAGQALATARRNVRRQQDLLAQGLSSRKQVEEAQLKEADVLKELTAARAELARIEGRLARQGRQEVRAPRAGVILRQVAGGGGVYVKQGDPLAVLVPETRSRAVELWMDGNDLPLLRRDQEVRLQFEGWPALQFSGWPALAVGTVGGRIAFVDAESARPGQFRILVTPPPGEQWPSPELLLQGVRAHGWVLLGEVPLGYELWRRFNDFPPALPTPAETGPGQESGAEKGGSKEAPAEEKGGGKEKP